MKKRVDTYLIGVLFVSLLCLVRFHYVQTAASMEFVGEFEGMSENEEPSSEHGSSLEEFTDVIDEQAMEYLEQLKEEAAHEEEEEEDEVDADGGEGDENDDSQQKSATVSFDFTSTTTLSSLSFEEQFIKMLSPNMYAYLRNFKNSFDSITLDDMQQHIYKFSQQIQSIYNARKDPTYAGAIQETENELSKVEDGTGKQLEDVVRTDFGTLLSLDLFADEVDYKQQLEVVESLFEDRYPAHGYPTNEDFTSDQIEDVYNLTVVNLQNFIDADDRDEAYEALMVVLTVVAGIVILEL